MNGSNSLLARIHIIFHKECIHELALHAYLPVHALALKNAHFAAN